VTAAGARLRVDPIACDGRGLCAEVLPELISLDDWGYPIIRDEEVSTGLLAGAGEAIRLCPLLALRLDRSGARRAHGRRPHPSGRASPLPAVGRDQGAPPSPGR
jgi:ferredoxin